MVNSMVARATSDMLIGPDWAMNIEISDILNRDPSQAKEIVKGIKNRIRSKRPKVQILALTLLETIVKNCGDIVHMHVAEKNVLQEMVKIVKKKQPDHQVKEKVLILIDTWQEAFGGPRARYPQYYAAYQELLHAGAVFPQRSERSAPVLTPPQSHPLSSYSVNGQTALNHEGAGANSSVEPEYPTLSLSEIQNARGSMDVLAEMLNALDPGNKEALSQEALVDLVDQCRTYKKRVVHLVNSTTDESLLCQGLSLNDDLQRVLAKYESIISGAGTPAEKPKPESAVHDLVDVDGPRDLIDTGESSKAASERSSGSDNLMSLSVPPAANGTAAASNTDPKMDLLSGDLLGGDDFGSTTQNSLAIVPVSDAQPSSPVASEQNALVLADMFSANNGVQNPPNGPTALSNGSGLQQQQQHFQQNSLYQNGMNPNMGSPYDPSGNPLGPVPSWSPHSAQQQQRPSSPAYGAQNGDSFPAPPWESQQPDTQPFGAPQPPTMQQQHPPIGLPTANNDQVAGMFVQPITGAQLATINQPYQMPMYPQHMPGYPQPMYAHQMPGYPQPMYPNQMPGYPNQMPGYGYGGYGQQQQQQQEAQYLEQRMYGMSITNDSALKSGASNQNSMASYLPPMKQKPRGDDKLFGDLVSIAKTKPSTNPPGRNGSI